MKIKMHLRIEVDPDVPMGRPPGMEVSEYETEATVPSKAAAEFVGCTALNVAIALVSGVPLTNPKIVAALAEARRTCEADAAPIPPPAAK